jgi:Tfp pilus assembly protein PilF
MHSNRHIAVGLALALSALSGCAGGQLLRAPSSDISADRQQRKGQAIQQFEQYRDSVQLEAAIDRWRQNDVAGCESRLRTLISRRPDYVEARLRLAELAWSQNDAAEAEGQYRAALELAPDRPETLHALGLVLEATGRSDEARSLFAEASQLAPDDEVLRLAAER